jgi:hypothetical protein
MSTRNNATSNVDPGEYSDRIGSQGLRGNANRRAMSYDKWEGQTKFNVIVLSHPLPIRSSKVNMFMNAKAAEGADAWRNPNDPNDSWGAMYFYGRIHSCPGVPGPTTPHSAYGNPCAMNATSNPMLAAVLTKKHTKFISTDSYVGKIPSIGDLVEVELSTGWSKYNLQHAKYDRLAMASEGEYSEAMLQGTCDSLESLFDRFDGSDVGDADLSTLNISQGGSQKVASDIRALKELNEPLPPGQRLISQMPSANQDLLVAAVNEEYNRWTGAPPYAAPLVEGNGKNPGTAEYEILTRYWQATAPEWPDSTIHNNIIGQQTRSGVSHWSSVYISYIFWEAFSNPWPPVADNPHFNSSSAHIYYMSNRSDMGDMWKVYDAQPSTTTGAIQAQVGDVLVSVYNGGARSVVNAHGDVVFKIDQANLRAYLSGGNVGDSVTVTRSVAIDSNGNYVLTQAGMQSPTGGYPYYSIMKYKPKTESYSAAPATT